MKQKYDVRFFMNAAIEHDLLQNKSIEYTLILEPPTHHATMYLLISAACLIPTSFGSLNPLSASSVFPSKCDGRITQTSYLLSLSAPLGGLTC